MRRIIKSLLFIILTLAGSSVFGQVTMPTPPNCAPCSFTPGTGGNVYSSDGSFWYNRGDGYDYYYASDGYAYVFDTDGNQVGVTLLQDSPQAPSDDVTSYPEGFTDEGGDGDYDPEELSGDDGTSNPDGPDRPNPNIPVDCAGVPYGTAYINNCGNCVGGNTGVPDYCPTSSSFYITLNNYTTRYYKGDTIYAPEQSSYIKLTLHDANNPTVNTTDLTWYKNGSSTACHNVDNCLFSGSRSVSDIVIDSATQNITVNYLVVYTRPIIYFRRGSSYNGEYGFDDYDSTFSHLRDSARYRIGYEVRRIGSDSSYKVPWMSLLDKQSATINIRKVWPDSAWVVKDVNSSVTFKPNNPFIKVNNSPFVQVKYTSLNTFNTIDVYAEQWQTNNDSVRYTKKLAPIVKDVYAVTDNLDTLGKLHLSCAKPSMKNVVLVYVNVGTGYDSTTLSKSSVLDYLNNNSHNQLMRQWQLKTSYPDTLNLTSEYSLYPSTFTNKDSILYYFKKYYKAHTGYDIDHINVFQLPRGNKKVHFYFFSKLTISGVYAVTELGYYTGSIFYNAGIKTVPHEFGHVLNLGHTFEPPLNVTQNSTTNYMDSRRASFDGRRWFAFYQWKLVY
jgi:hypothetical protein